MEIKGTQTAGKASPDRIDSAAVPSSNESDLPAPGVRGRDGYDVRLSGKAKELSSMYSEIFDIAKNTDPVREDRVRELKAQIDAGTYVPDSGNIADGILREAVKDHLAISERR